MVTAPERPFAQRVQDATRRWKKKLGLEVEGGNEVGTEVTSSSRSSTAPVRLGDMSRPSSGGRLVRFLAYVTLILTALGLLWQGGYLRKPLGLIPVISHLASPVQEAGAHALAGDSTGEVGDADDYYVETSSAVAQSQLPLAVSGGEFAATEVVAPLDRSDSAPPAGGSATRRVVEDVRPYVIRIASYVPGSTWSVQAVNELRREDEDAFLAQKAVKGKLFERLLVGRFASWDEAFRHASDLQSRDLVDEFAILRLPFSVELAQYPHPEHAERVIQHLGTLSHAAHTRSLADDTVSLQVGAFETAAEARQSMRHFMLFIDEEGEEG